MVDPRDFAPGILRVQDRPPSPLGRMVLWTVLGLFGATLVWALVGRLDVVAVADGKLVPASYVKIVQPAEQGIVKEILVQEGDAVKEGQVLIRMDAVIADADVRTIRTEHDNRQLALRRIDAQLAGRPFRRELGDLPELFGQIAAQHAANVQAYENALAQERSVMDKARHDLAAAEQTKAKLAQVLPHYLEQEKAFEKLARDGFAGRIMATDKARERIEKEQDLRTQEFIIRSNTALISQSERRLAQITADYRRQLQTERVEVASQYERARQELAKIAHRHGLLELKAPADGTVKDLATHTAGTVTAPGTILMTLVPKDERMVAEVWVGNQDVGFVRPGQPAKIKLAPYQFQKYGMIEGRVKQVSADATEAPSANTRSDALSGRDRPMGPLAYRALVELESQVLAVDGERYAVSPGMQVAAEIKLGTRTVMEYLLSPVRKAFHEAGRER
jgi:HlyD family secretion protein